MHKFYFNPVYSTLLRRAHQLYRANTAPEPAGGFDDRGRTALLHSLSSMSPKVKYKKKRPQGKSSKNK
jgi:hypothetical protein